MAACVVRFFSPGDTRAGAFTLRLRTNLASDGR